MGSVRAGVGLIQIRGRDGFGRIQARTEEGQPTGPGEGQGQFEGQPTGRGGSGPGRGQNGGCSDSGESRGQGPSGPGEGQSRLGLRDGVEIGLFKARGRDGVDRI